MSVERLGGSFVYEDSVNEFLRKVPMRSFYRLTCDICGAHLSICDSFQGAVKSGKPAGWKSYHNDADNLWENVCPDCQDFYDANVVRISAASDFEGVGVSNG